MTSRWKRRYPGRTLRQIAAFLGLCLGLYLVMFSTTHSITAADLPEYARKIFRMDHNLTRSDITLIYALSQEMNPVDFSTPKRIVFSYFPGWERVDISEQASATVDTVRAYTVSNNPRPICTVLYICGGDIRYFDRRHVIDRNARNTVDDPKLNHAALCAYLFELKGRSSTDDFIISACHNSSKNGDRGYRVSIDTLPPRVDGTIYVRVSRDFKQIDIPKTTYSSVEPIVPDAAGRQAGMLQ